MDESISHVIQEEIRRQCEAAWLQGFWAGESFGKAYERTPSGDWYNAPSEPINPYRISP